MSEKFLYFAYGSNMLQSRILHKNPSAVFKCIGKLKDHRMDFNYFSNRWHGAVATIVPEPGSIVWGVIWEIDICDLKALDIQEGVFDGVYLRQSVKVESDIAENFDCQVYLQRKLPENYYEPDKLPNDRQPSYVYFNVITTGAEDHKLPADYIQFLKSFLHNGYDGETDPTRSLLDK